MLFFYSKTSKPHVLILDLGRGEKSVAFSNLSIYYTWKNIKSSYNNKFKISAPTWNDEFELPDGSYILYQTFRIILSIL